MKYWILLMLVFLVGCSSTRITEYDPDGEKYRTPSRHLSIAVIGQDTPEPINNVTYTRVIWVVCRSRIARRLTALS